MSSALVILSEELTAHPRELAPEIAPLLGMVLYDVVAAFNRSPVLPFEDLPDERAAAAAQRLTERGLPAAAVPAERLPPPAKVFTVHNADVEPGGLNVQTDLAGAMRELPWDGIAALSVATITVSRGMSGMRQSSTAARAAGMMVGLAGGRLGLRSMRRRARDDHKRARAMKQRFDSSEVLALLPREAPVELRFRGNAFNYDYLGERLSASVRDNFRTFARDLLERAGGARVSAGLRALAESGTDSPQMSVGAFSAYNRWLRLMAEGGAPGAAGSGEGPG
jgi:hypothetical protein